MSSVRGTISVDVAFTDSTTVGGAQSLKTITLRDATEYTTGKVAILTGTAGTASVTLGQVGTVPTTTYKDSSGEFVSFAAIRRVAFSWSGSQRTLTDAEYDLFKLNSASGSASLTSVTNADLVNPVISSGTGTGSYTIILYGT